MPASAYAESLVDPMRAGRADAIEDFVDSAPIEIVSIDRRIARRAAALRAERPTLRLPDALVLATGDVLDADEVLTGDRRLSSASDRVRAL
jgi:predicted nucleic acid-binding protein